MQASSPVQPTRHVHQKGLTASHSIATAHGFHHSHMYTSVRFQLRLVASYCARVLASAALARGFEIEAEVVFADVAVWLNISLHVYDRARPTPDISPPSLSREVFTVCVAAPPPPLVSSLALWSAVSRASFSNGMPGDSEMLENGTSQTSLGRRLYRRRRSRDSRDW
jgi:hypothetical protein